MHPIFESIPFLKKFAKSICSEKLKNHTWTRVTAVLLAFWSCKVHFFQTWSSFILLYIIKVFYPLLLMLIMFLPWHNVINVSEVVFRWWLPCLSSLYCVDAILRNDIFNLAVARYWSAHRFQGFSVLPHM